VQSVRLFGAWYLKPWFEAGKFVRADTVDQMMGQFDTGARLYGGSIGKAWKARAASGLPRSIISRGLQDER
jgi:hypothetical protein